MKNTWNLSILRVLSIILFSACDKTEIFSLKNIQLKGTLVSKEYQYVDSIGSYLTSPQLEGRKAESKGDSLAMVCIANEFSNDDLMPYPSNSYYNEFTYNGIHSYNLIGCKYGTDPTYRDSIIIVCAHHDHLGLNANGIQFPGANDNASGVTCLLLLAQKLKGRDLKRTVIFMSTGAEEKGLYGMKAFRAAKIIPDRNIKYIFNYDIVGGLKDSLFVCAKNINEKIEKIIIEKNVDSLSIGFIRNNWTTNWATSDHAVYAGNKFPALGITTGYKYFHENHTINDTWDKININGIIAIEELFYRTIVEVANE
jgi:Zn-dependent M28 family amino/carboxypeptidase